MVSQKSLGAWLLSLLRSPFSMDLLETVPAFVVAFVVFLFVCLQLELGGSAFRGTDLLALVGNQLLPCCLSIVEVVPTSESV